MDNKFKQLAIDSHIELFDDTGVETTQGNLQKFAELVEQYVLTNITKIWYEQGLDLKGAELHKLLASYDELTK